MIDDLGPSILGIGIYAASVQEALSHGWGLLESFGAAVIPSVVASVAAYPFIARISENRQRRQNHNEHIVSRAVDPAIHILRNNFETGSLSEALGYPQDHTSLQTDQTLKGIVRPTNEWRWLREHEPEVGEFSEQLEDQRASFVDAYSEWKSQVAEELLQTPPAQELDLRERTAGQVAHAILQHAARKEEGKQPGAFREELHVNEYESRTELVARQITLTQGDKEVVDGFVTAISEVESSDMVNEAVAELQDRLAEIREVENELRRRFDRMAAERAPQGSCEQCSFNPIGRLWK